MKETENYCLLSSRSSVRIASGSQDKQLKPLYLQGFCFFGVELGIISFSFFLNRFIPVNNFKLVPFLYPFYGLGISLKKFATQL